MDKKYLYLIIGIILLILIVLAARNIIFSPSSNVSLSNATATPSVATSSATSAPATTSAKTGDLTGLGLTVPPGFAISVFVKNLPGARVMAFDSFGNLWVSQPSRGTVSVVEIDRNTGLAKRVNVALRGLNNPHGLAFDSERQSVLYVAEEDKISRVTVYSDDQLQKIADLPAGQGHDTRTIKFGPDGKLYVSIGSSCNVCRESDERRAKIFSLNPDGTGFEPYATGLRNAVFFTWDQSGRMWATEMGRDHLGDNLPPDEINIVRKNGNYGWPICYGKNIHDTDFDKNTYIRNPCQEPTEIASHIDVPAHSAPLGLSFAPESNWPARYQRDLIVAYHGSWNRSTPTGYKLVRYELDAQGNLVGREDFITGWLKNGRVAGRPADIVVRPGGVMYVSDDRAGLIYKITYPGP